MGFGMAMFWTASDANIRTVAVGLVSGTFGNWMSSGSSSLKKSVKLNSKDQKEQEALIADKKPISDNVAPIKDIDSLIDAARVNNDLELTDVKIDQ